MAELAQAWFYLTDNGDTHGPFDVGTMKELYKGKYVTEDALVWAEGEPEWIPLKASHALYAALEFQDTSCERASAPKDAALANFEAEIAAIEATAPEVESPPPEERQFEDDDGTTFVWDTQLRKFKPLGVELPASNSDAAPARQGMQAAPEASYTADMMVYDFEEEVVPTIQQALAQEQEQIARELESEEQGAGGVKAKAAKGKQSAAVSDRAGQDDPSSAAAQNGGKRKADNDVDENNDTKKSKKQEATWFELKNNTSVYVTGIPDDATVEEIAQEFQRCGIIKLDDNKQPRIKIYRDKTGAPKGDCLVTFLQQPSVKLALTVMDGRQLRPGRGANMTVQEAHFQQKGDYVPKAKANKKAGRKKVIEQQERLLGWQGYDDTYKPAEVTVILLHMFTLEEMLVNPGLGAELQADVMNECKQFGAIDKLHVYSKNPLGAVSVKFRTPEAAQGCIDLMNGRFFAGRQVTASLWDGKTNYNEAAKHKETEEEQAARLEAFATELENA